MKRQQLAAVITGDIIQSTSLGQQERTNMLVTLEKVIADGKEFFPDWNAEIFQGDSFQGSTLKGVKSSLGYSIACIAQFREQGFGIRIAIGIGEISFTAATIGTSNGSAFVQSGRTLEELKKRNGSYIGIKTGDADLDEEFEVHCTILDFLLARCTVPQSQALILAINGFTQVEIAERLHIAQPTVQQRLKAGGWPVFKAILQRFAAKY
jgi:hypothetical protein